MEGERSGHPDAQVTGNAELPCGSRLHWGVLGSDHGRILVPETQSDGGNDVFAATERLERYVSSEFAAHDPLLTYPRACIFSISFDGQIVPAADVQRKVRNSRKLVHRPVRVAPGDLPKPADGLIAFSGASDSEGVIACGLAADSLMAVAYGDWGFALLHCGLASLIRPKVEGRWPDSVIDGLWESLQCPDFPAGASRATRIALIEGLCGTCYEFPNSHADVGMVRARVTDAEDEGAIIPGSRLQSPDNLKVGIDLPAIVRYLVREKHAESLVMADARYPLCVHPAHEPATERAAPRYSHRGRTAVEQQRNLYFAFMTTAKNIYRSKAQ